MTVTVNATNYSLLDDCEDAATWNGESPADVIDFYQYGTQCVGFTVRDAAQADIYLDTGTYDLSGNVHLRCWFMTTALKEMDLFANDGVQFYVTDGADTAYWTVLGSDTYPGGWYPLVVDLTSTPTSGTIPTDMSVCTTIGLRFNTTDTAKNFQNTWIDHLHLSDGLEAYGDDGGGSFDLADILSVEVDPTNGGWGILRRISGIYYLAGGLVFGDGSGTSSCDFLETSKTIVFENRQVSSTCYRIEIVDNGTGTTEFQLGTKSGTSGISGCVVQTESLSQTAKYAIIATDSDITNFLVYGSKFIDHGDVALPPDGTYIEVIDTSFEAGLQVDLDTCDATGVSFISSDSGQAAALIQSTSHNLSYSKFVGCPVALEIDTAGSYTLTSVDFVGNTTDVENSASGTDTASYTTQDTSFSLGGGKTYDAIGQSFAGDSGYLANAIFRLGFSGSPTGDIYAKVYAHSGTFGTSSVPTGTALATSESIDAADVVAQGVGEYRFRFNQVTTDNNIQLTASYYVVTLEYTGGDASNYLYAYYDQGAAGAEPGNMSERAVSGGTWSALANDDAYYKVRTGGIVVVNSTGAASAASQDKAIETATIPGSTTVKNTVTLTVTVKNVDGDAIEGAGVFVFDSAGPFNDTDSYIRELTNSSGVATEQFNYTSPLAVRIVVRKSSPDPITGKRYELYDGSGTIGASGLDVVVTLAIDRTQE